MFSTVNGGITLNVPAGLSSYLRAETRNGKVVTDLGGLRGRITDNSIDARIGGGSKAFPLTLQTINGTIHVRRAL
jgi:hypothetical protein